MSRRYLLRQWLPGSLSRIQSAATAARPRLGLEPLEDRAVPASAQVTNTNDAGGGSFRQALVDINNSADANNTITFLPGLFGTINITSADLPKIGKPVDIQGPGAALISLNGGNAKALFNIDDATATAIAVTISGLKITGGKAAEGGAVFVQNENVTLREVIITGNTATGQGGGIRANAGAVTLVNSQVSNNTATDGAGIRNAGATFAITGSTISENTATNATGTGGYYQSGGALQDLTNSAVTGNKGGLGGGLYVTGGPATLVNSVVANNKATVDKNSDGGGLVVAGGTVSLKNVTVSGNVANDEGGGIRITSGTLEVRNSTIAFNAANANDAADGDSSETGGGLFVAAGKTASIFSTIIANNTKGVAAPTPSDVNGAVDATSSFNLVRVDTGLTGITNATQGNLIGTAGTPREPNLQPLAFNGGRTKTHAITAGSAAKDNGDVTGLGLTTDQRAEPFARVVGTKADIGAYELPAGPITLTVTTTADEDDATFDAANLSLREALRLAGTDAPTINFDPALNGKAITLTRGRLNIDRALSLTGPGADKLTVNGNNLFQIIRVDDGVTATAIDVSISGLTLTGGKADVLTGGDFFGGAMRTFENVTLDKMVLTGNVATSDSGGIDHQFGNLTVKNSTISNNKSGTVGGGIGNFSAGTVSVQNSTISANQANGTNGGGLFNVGAGTVVVSNSTLSGNTAKNDGGGLFSSAGTVIVNNSTVAFNKADSDNAGGGKGGGIFIGGGTAKMTGTIVAKNEVGTAGANPDISGKVDGKFSLVFNTTGWDQSGSSNNKLTLDPLLGPLTFNGGPTQTHLPAATSPAVDPGFTDAQINPDGLTTDQRGFARKFGTSIDIGAVEFAPNTNPTISDIPNQPTSAAGAVIGPITFTVGDNETPVAALTVTGLSNNTTLVPTANIAIAGTGADRTVTITPAAGQTGTATITLTVADGNGGTATDTFTVTVGTNANPTISDIPNQPTSAVGAVIGPINFTVGDNETAVDALTVTGASSNATLVPAAGIVITGTGANRTVTITPAAGQTGTATITLTVADGNGGTATDTFTVTVGTNANPTITTISNPAAVTPGTAIGPLTFTVGDTETPVANLTVAGTSSNTTLVPNANIVVAGTGADRTVTVTPAAGQTGTAVISLTVSDGSGGSAVSTFTVTVNATGAVTPVLVGFPQFGAGQDVGGGQVTFFGPDKTALFTATPFPGFTGGVRTAAADFNGDGVADLVVGTGPGQATRVLVLDGKTQAQLFAVDPFEATFTGGVYVAAGDVTGDGVPDLVITPDEGGGPRCRVFNGVGVAAGTQSVVADFFGIDDPNFRGGARAAIGDVNGDGVGDLVVAAGFQGGPRVAGYSGPSLATGTPSKVFPDFFAFEQTLRNGVFVTAGDIDGDGKAEVIAGGGPGGGPRVQAFSGAQLIASQFTPIANFFGGDPNNRGGIRVAVKNLDGDNRADLVVGSGTGAGSRVTSYLGKNIAPSGTPAAQFDFDAFSGFTGGVFVG